ncbi:MAG: YodL domain-containing protein, partial [Lachnospiraceae bacterium]|nr:YodL domain-containing protein [Lachnospiraceae bacterium]
QQGKEPQMEHYDVVYTGRLYFGTRLDDLFVQFNVFHPDDFTGHSLSVSDIVALKQDEVVSCYYVDSIGFCRLPDFHPENYLKNAEVLLEDDLSMLDGIINNGSKDMEEERPSVLEKLKNMPEQASAMKPAMRREERGLE